VQLQIEVAHRRHESYEALYRTAITRVHSRATHDKQDTFLSVLLMTVRGSMAAICEGTNEVDVKPDVCAR
jgi:hypothetical protein